MKLSEQITGKITSELDRMSAPWSGQGWLLDMNELLGILPGEELTGYRHGQPCSMHHNISQVRRGLDRKRKAMPVHAYREFVLVVAEFCPCFAWNEDIQDYTLFIDENTMARPYRDVHKVLEQEKERCWRP